MKLKRKVHVPTVIGILVIAILSVSVFKTIRHNIALKTQVDQLNTRVIALQSEQDDLKYKIEYYKTDSFVEKEARAKLGLQEPGEGVIILPRANETTVPENAGQSKAKPKSNLSQWREFLFG
jgi:cell division protein FtsB